MTPHLAAQRLLVVAARIAETDPLLAYDLERSVLAIANPGKKKHEDHLNQSVTVLKSLKQELEQALKDYETAEEFAKFFTDGIAEEEELKKLLGGKKTAAASDADTAGIKDFVKNVFKKKDKKDVNETTSPDHAKEWGETDSGPSYRMEDSQMDEFVDGKREWADPGHYVEQESKENGEFSTQAKSVLDEMTAARKSPSKSTVQKLLKQVEVAIRHGENLLKGAFKHLEEPAAQVKVDNSDKKSPPSAPSGGKSVFNLEGTIEHYADMLKENAGNEQKLKSLLRELFKAVEPLVKTEKAQMASRRVLATGLVRVAHANPESRAVLLPVIRHLTGR